ncbi:MAG TPA: RICIN domain-containing protein [Ktedonobacteraceae bacterium]
MKKGFSLVPALIMLIIMACLPATSFASSTRIASSAHASLLARQFQHTQNAANSNVVYNGGPVMDGTVNVYVIFWEPAGNVSASYNSLITRYFNDVGSSALYKNNAQYSSAAGAPSGSTLAGTWTDTQAYPQTPLLDSDIQSEISHAQSTQGWSADTHTLFFVLTEKNVSICLDSSQALCTVNTPETFCGYHNYFATNTIYAAIPYAASFSCKAGFSPNNDDADQTVNVLSREQMNAVTDPLLNGWHDASGSEIGDKCSWSFGISGSQGSDVTWNNNSYIVQEEWSNAQNNCTLGSPAPTYYRIINQNSGLGLEVSHGSLSSGGVVDQWGSNGSPTQMWSLVQRGPYYQIVNGNSGLTLEVARSTVSFGGAVDQWGYNGSATQQWRLVPAGNAYHIINRNSGLALEVYHSGTAAGTKVDQWISNESATQSWTLVPVTTPFYKIKNVNSGLNLQINGGSTAAGAQIVQQPNASTADQLWTILPRGSNYQIVNVRSGYVLEVYHSGTTRGAIIDQWSNNGSLTQQWQLFPDANSCLSGVPCQLRNVNSGLYMEVYHSSTSAGAIVDQWTGNGTSTQNWIFTALP